MKNIKEFSTKELVEELKAREAVVTKLAEPYEELNVGDEKIVGPAIILIIVD